MLKLSVYRAVSVSSLTNNTILNIMGKQSLTIFLGTQTSSSRCNTRCESVNGLSKPIACQADHRFPRVMRRFYWKKV
jgi:hypothetical protein